MRDVFPCIGLWARTISAPYAVPIAWWPRQTPWMGMAAPNSRMALTEMPASVGEHGPGETMMCVGASARISASEILSFLTTTGCSPSSRTCLLYTSDAADEED